MKNKFLPILGIAIISFFVLSRTVFASEMDEIKEGEEIWQKLGAEQIKCSELSDTQFESLGEFFMDKMVGSSHQAMDQRVQQVEGEEGLRSMHIVMGKRMSGCNLNKGGDFFMGPWMMGWGGSSPSADGLGWGMMGNGSWFTIWTILSWISWVLVIVALIALIRWLWKKGDK